MPAETVLVILGNTNDAAGNLSAAALSRLEAGLDYVRKLGEERRRRTFVLTTGGFGTFNPSPIPHGELMARHLLARGLPSTQLLPYVHSNGTIDDAHGVAARLAESGPAARQVVLVTSAFHMPRASVIFRRVMPGIALQTIADEDLGTPEQRIHEARAMRNLDRELPPRPDRRFGAA